MQKVGNTTDTADANGEYTNGNVAKGIPPTIINAEMLNTFQRELVNTVEGAGIDLDAGDFGQLLKAIKKIVTEATSSDIDKIYPVGVVVWFAQNKNPNTLFPKTTWKYIGENRTIRLGKADGTDIMSVGGADAVKLTQENLPAHNHAFSANTSSFDHGNKVTDLFDYGTKRTDIQGDHQHTYMKPDYPNGNGASGSQYSLSSTPYPTTSAGDHSHSVVIGGHSHTIAIGSHSHSVSGVTGNSGTGTEISVVNSFIKLMGWFRTS
ncbi:phage baseplate protein [Serratia nevei]|uniref:phage baseplate protein n=1 Tax=Serratia nevei TaxID=2703794 RepID=UPI00285F93F5|nr:hypothetical protein [Serratia nevei]MDR8480710.1 hypothetical protein [Serratia nevei]